MKCVQAAKSKVPFICKSRDPQGNELPELVLGRLNWLGAVLYLLFLNAAVQKKLTDCTVCVREKRRGFTEAKVQSYARAFLRDFISCVRNPKSVDKSDSCLYAVHHHKILWQALQMKVFIQ